LEGKTAVITGAASGIGAATARLYASEGASLLLADVQKPEGEALAQALGAAFLCCDVTRSSDLAALATDADAQLGGVDILFANAGRAAEFPTEEMTEDLWRSLIDVNLTGAWLTCRAFLPGMIERGTGTIIATASQLGLIGMERIAAYGAAKAGVINLVRCIAADFGRLGIRANALCPGPTRTEGTARMFSKAPNPDEAVRTMAGKTVLDRLAEPEEIAWGAVFLGSDESSYMTGAALVIDGGHTAI
jgi:NAD(P)-dependent dehydrogenase (short-subunit alcohol dehydrogenase family)